MYNELLNKSAIYFDNGVVPSPVRVIVLRYVSENGYLVGSIDGNPKFYTAPIESLTIEKNDEQPKFAEQLSENLLDIYIRQQGE